MSAILQNKLGTITYSDDYIGSIAGLTTTECYGVVGMSSKKMTDGFVDLLKGENLKRGVKVYTDKSNSLRIDLYIVVEYGISIYAASSSIIETVRYNIEKSTGLNVKEVNIIVSGIRVQQ